MEVSRTWGSEEERSSILRWEGFAHVPLWLLFGFVGCLVLYPMAMILYGGFWSSMPGEPGHFTLDGYRTAFSQPGLWRAMWNTYWLAITTKVIAISFAIFFAWVIARTDTPGKIWLEVGFWLYFFMPFMPMTMAWVLLLAPNFGLINQALEKTVLAGRSPLNIHSYWGIIWVSTLTTTSFMVLLITPAFRRMEASLEDAARMSGASIMTSLRQVVIPLLAPTILGILFLSFIRGIEAFETPLVLGYQAGIHVYATKIFELLHQEPPAFPQAMALTHGFLLTLFLLILIQNRLLKGKTFTTIGGRGFSVRPISLGRWRYVTFAICLVWILVGTVLPVATLIVGSFMRIFGVFLEGTSFTTKHWEYLIRDSSFWFSLKNTLVMGAVAATAGMLLHSLISYVIVKTNFKARKSLELITWFPWAVPGIIWGLGMFWAYVGGIRLPFTLYGTLWIMIMAMVIKEMPIGIRAMNGGLLQLGSELEESARVHGASFFRTFRSIVAPLLAPTFIATWIIIFLTSVRDLSTVILLYSAKSKVLSVLNYELWASGRMESAMAVGLVTTLIVVVAAVAARILGAKQEIQ
jgi:iron(III) transport system permease protein